MTTYLTTGGAGFIGSNMVLYLLRSRPDVKVVNLDALTYAGNMENLKDAERDERHVFVHGNIGDRALVESLLEEHDPDYVVNFAAESHVDRSIADPTVFVDSNVKGTANLLLCCKKAWRDDARKTWKRNKKFVQISTDEVYGALGPEGFFTEKSPINPHSPYSASKASADLFVQAFRDVYGLPMNIARCSNNYGAKQGPEKLVPLMIINAINHRTLPVYGDGLQIRDWLYVEDCCRAIDMVATSGKDGEVYNVGCRNERTNLSVVKTIVELTNRKLNDPAINEELIKHVEDRPGHDRRYGVDPTKIETTLGWRPETSFEVGLEKTVDWYLENKEWVERATSGEYQKYYVETYKNRR